MRNELNNKHTDLNPFEAPSNLWDRIEEGLDQKESKRKGFVWWSVAAGIALLGGIGYTVISFLSNNPTQNTVVAENKLPTILEDSTIAQPQARIL